MLVLGHSSNKQRWDESDFEQIQQAGFQGLVTLTITDVDVLARADKLLAPPSQWIARLWWPGRPPAPTEFVAAMKPKLQAYQNLGLRYIVEILTEPNHFSGGPGWGITAEAARDFRLWYHLTLKLLRREFPTLEFGFPALCAVPDLKTDLVWLDVCEDAVEASDFLAVHCYWQYDNVTSPDWGYRFLQYHARFPDKTLWITEFGDSTPDVSHERKAEEYLAFWKEVAKYPYIAGAAPFLIGGTPDWAEFALAGPEIQAARQAIEYLHEQSTPDFSPPKTLLKWGIPTYDLRRSLPTGGNYPTRELKQIERIIIHHTAVNTDLSAQDIARYHVEHNHWPGIGYHFLVHQNRLVDWCNDLRTVSYHAGKKGDEQIQGISVNNWSSIGICLSGNFIEGRLPTPQQLLATRVLIALLEYYLGRRLKVLGHQDLGGTCCPGDAWGDWRKQL